MRYSSKLRLIFTVPLLGVTLWAANAFAEDARGSATYIKLSKGMVVNYGEPSLSRLKYMKIAVQVRLDSASGSDAVAHHMPALLDTLLVLFSSCDEDLLISKGGREEIRQRALEAVQNLMQEEEGEPLIDDLLFGSFIVQK